MSTYTRSDRVLTHCLICEETLQTDGDQVPSESGTFDELLDNFGRESDSTCSPEGHVLGHEIVD